LRVPSGADVRCRAFAPRRLPRRGCGAGTRGNGAFSRFAEPALGRRTRRETTESSHARTPAATRAQRDRASSRARKPLASRPGAAPRRPRGAASDLAVHRRRLSNTVRPARALVALSDAAAPSRGESAGGHKARGHSPTRTHPRPRPSGREAGRSSLAKRDRRGHRECLDRPRHHSLQHRRPGGPEHVPRSPARGTRQGQDCAYRAGGPCSATDWPGRSDGRLEPVQRQPRRGRLRRLPQRAARWTDDLDQLRARQPPLRDDVPGRGRRVRPGRKSLPEDALVRVYYGLRQHGR
jgi:hypothetical protein